MDWMFVLVGNGRFYGGQIPLLREARNDDGKLDVLVLPISDISM
jgi:diacylglycerol kinase family enzyme